MNTKHVLIETLTPLHIGSGRMLQGNTEYLYFQEARTVAVVDEHKILDIIGEDQLEAWIGIINRGDDLLTYLNTRRAGVKPADTSRRIMAVIGKRSPGGNQTVREQLFSGNGQPILPGSSLKGSIRTAVLNALIKEKPAAARRINDVKRFNERKQKYDYAGQKLEGKYFSNVNMPGEAPNHDVFRLLRIGDAHFDQTVCLLSETLNELGNGTFEMKDSVKQFIECIPAGAETICRVQIPAELKARLNEVRYREVGDKMPHRDRIEWPKLLNDINANTRRLIQNELNRYQSQLLPDDGAGEYLDSLKGMMTGLKTNQCVIRVGFGTGYLNMTGGWAEEQWKDALPKEKFDAEMTDLAREIRHDRNGKHDRWSQVLPKSRKMVLGGVPLGFLKLTVFSENEFADWQVNASEREAARTQKVEVKRLAAEAAAQTAAEAEATRLEEERIKAEEARKPTLFDGTLKQGQELDAEVIASGKPNKVKVYAVGYEDKSFDLIGYAGLLAVGTVVVVKADQLNSKKVLLQIRYQKMK